MHSVAALSQTEKAWNNHWKRKHSAVVLLQQFCNVTVNTIKQLKHCGGIWNAGPFPHLYHRKVTGWTVKRHLFATSFVLIRPKKLTRGICVWGMNWTWISKWFKINKTCIPSERVSFSEVLLRYRSDCTKDEITEPLRTAFRAVAVQASRRHSHANSVWLQCSCVDFKLCFFFCDGKGQIHSTRTHFQIFLPLKLSSVVTQCTVSHQSSCAVIHFPFFSYLFTLAIEI